MDTRTSYVDISAISYENGTAGIFNFSISATTDLSGPIRPESTLKFTLLSINQEVGNEFIVQTHNPDGTLIESVTLSPITLLPSNDEDNNITSIELDFSGVGMDMFWQNINYIYKGKITEYILVNYVPA
jgi:hypothetical protein